MCWISAYFVVNSERSFVGMGHMSVTKKVVTEQLQRYLGCEKWREKTGLALLNQRDSLNLPAFMPQKRLTPVGSAQGEAHEDEIEDKVEKEEKKK